MFDKKRGKVSQDPVCIYKDEAFKGGEDIRFCHDDSYIIVSEAIYDKISVFEFDKNTGKIVKKITELTNPEARLSFPHGIDISSDGRYLAVANYGSDTCSIYAIEP